ncbi:membrane protein [Fulvitalea axinellae]|uniref:Membrane protein n=1 Tax=Fulvitalea axinellae TaxID=1182444 RepID=A0AAU9CFY7_9BACT|nr:membrane protein [Fulvitalea axinellae]
MGKIKTAVIIANLCLLAGYFVYSVSAKEKILADGKLVLLRLAPRDPRSLMQGDYMRLDYELARKMRDNNNKDLPKRGWCVLRVNAEGVADSIRLFTGNKPLASDEVKVRFDGANRFRISLGAESFFFQEGRGVAYRDAKYGGLRIDKGGHSVLVGLYNEDRKKIEDTNIVLDDMNDE